MVQEKKIQIGVKFYPSDLKKWRGKANKKNLTLTEYLTRKANDQKI